MASDLKTAIQIIRTLRAAGHEALLAGGCVRDQIMGREPKDYDIATSATPAQVQGLFPRNEPVGAAFGVILVLENGATYEVATFRTDLSYKDGRRPEGVQFSNPEEDAKRRDFTVNGMFFNPESGTVTDYVSGRADIQNKKIRCIGDPLKRFEEDKLRVLRAVRFAAELDFEIDPATKAAIRQFAPQVTQVAWERIGIEMNKLLLCPSRRKGLELLDELGLLPILLPELEPMKGCDQPPQFHPEGDVWVHTLLALEKLEKPSLDLAWAALLHDVGKPPCRTQAPGDRVRFNCHESKGSEMALEICRRFKLSNEDTERVRILVAEHMRANQVQEMRVSTLKRFFRADHFSELMELLKADCRASHGDMTLYDFCVQKMAEFEKQGREAVLKPKPLITGDDLISLGYKPGKKFKEILTAVENEQLEGRLKSRDDALNFLKNNYA